MLTRSWWRRWSPWIGGAIGLASLVWVLRGIDGATLLATVAAADFRFLVLVPIAIAGEQLVRAWKWRQLLYPIQPVGVFSLFGAIMAGYFAGHAIPFGAGPVVRSWLVARRAELPTSAVLATVALDRLIDGVVFASLVPVALILAAVPDADGSLRASIGWAGAGSFAVFVVLLVALAGYRAQMARGGWIARGFDRLPPRAAAAAGRLARSFAEGIVWPREAWRRAGIVLASVAIKLVAATHILWAGLAVGVLLRPADYLLLLVFFGFLSVVTHAARIPAGFTVGAVFALGLFGVSEEPGLAAVLILQGASLLTVAGIGGMALWWQGFTIGDLRSARETGDRRRG